MALLFMDGFDYIPASGGTLASIWLGSGSKWDLYYANGSIGTETSSTPFGFGGALDPVAGYLMKNLASNYATLIAGFYLNPLNIHYGLRLLSFYDGSTSQVHLIVDGDGHFEVLNNVGSSVAGVGATTLVSGTWYYIEFKATINSSTGSVYVRVNGSAEISATGLNLAASGNNYVNGIRLGNATFSFPGVNESYTDDFVLMDSSGSTMNGFQGPLRIYSVLPNSDVANAGWTLSSGSTINTLINETATSTANYVECATSTDSFLVGCGSLYGGSGNIMAVAVNSAAEGSGAGPPSFKNLLNSGSTALAGNSLTPVASTVGMFQTLYVTDPNTSAAWTTSAVNSIAVGAVMS